MEKYDRYQNPEGGIIEALGLTLSGAGREQVFKVLRGWGNVFSGTIIMLIPERVEALEFKKIPLLHHPLLTAMSEEIRKSPGFTRDLVKYLGHLYQFSNEAERSELADILQENLAEEVKKAVRPGMLRECDVPRRK